MRQTASRRRVDELPKGMLAALRHKALPPHIVDRKHVARPFQSRRAPPADSELTTDTWLLKAAHAGMEKIEFSDVEFELKGRTHNRFAWVEVAHNYRTFLVTKLRMRSGDEESDYAIETIKKEPGYT
ncbi:30S ribosomal protein S18 [Striga asiatica]|uniref:30S ribosomal protein S18 n=1 Tax=Striga asiatica TaxID=4170 RepID=A0A5A7QVJ3_STRAF|nr:30S ribosomal protein S18 [Striga asiatica]